MGPRPQPSERESSTEPEDSIDRFWPQTPEKCNSRECTRTNRIRIKTALDFNIPINKITEKYGYTRRQIDWARKCPQLTPQRAKCSRKPTITTPRRQRLEE